MSTGLVLGKFMPVHNGHLALINFALQNCDHLTVLLCHHPGEPITGQQRMAWLEEIFYGRGNISLLSYEYSSQELTDKSEADSMQAKKWANKIKTLVHKIDVFFSSEPYGDIVAAHLGAKHLLFDKARILVPVAASQIREKPFTHWSYLPAVVQPLFVKKVALLGSESTGKSTLTQRLAEHYQTAYVPEMAREVIGHTNECTYQNLIEIATLQAKEILAKTIVANKLLFSDTELTVTKSYAQFLFGKELQVPHWIEEANRFDLYLFLETDCSFVQDGTRLTEEERETLNESHKIQMKKSSINYKEINGDWDERFSEACRQIDAFISKF